MQQFGLKGDVQPLFAAVVLMDKPKTKDHLNVIAGETVFVLLIAHAKLPDGLYLVEKEDGTSKKINHRCVIWPSNMIQQSLSFSYHLCFVFRGSLDALPGLMLFCIPSFCNFCGFLFDSCKHWRFESCQVTCA